MAFPVTLNGRTYTLTDFEGTNYVDGLPDAFEDFVTHAGDIYNSTSTTSNSIGTGSKTFTVESNKPYQAGTPLRIADAAAPSTNFLDTVVTSYSGTTLVVNSIGYGGSGTKTSWTVNIGGAKTVDGTLGLSQGGTGATDAAGARTNIDVYSKADADSRFLNVSGEASNVTMTGDVTIGDAASDTLTVGATSTFNSSATISTGSSGASAASNADDLVVEASGDGGLSILTPSSNTGTLFFGDPSAGNAGQIKYSHSSDQFIIVTSQNTAIAIDSSQRTLLGKSSGTGVASSAQAKLQVSQNKTILNAAFDAYGNNAGGPILAFGSSRSSTVGTPGTIAQNNDNIGAIRFAADDGTDLQTQAALIIADVDGTPGANDMPGRLEFHTTADGASSATERMRINNAGDVKIGSGDPSERLHVDGEVRVEGQLGANLYVRDEPRSISPNYGSSTGIKMNVSDRNGNGSWASIIAKGSDAFQQGSSIYFTTDSTTGSEPDFSNGNIPSNVRMIIDRNGNVGIGTSTNPANTSGSAPRGQWLGGANSAFVSACYQQSCADFNRLNNDGTVVVIKQNGTTEGTISVSGTTVSYNGGHLARWSQTADNTRIDGLLKGTVMTNLDQMAVWGDEDNEQLNCMAVSSVEGDPNVAGVFVNWDNDDDIYTNDMNIAMTGDMIIRIAQGTTVQRGDLLMSAGDGTAKPQGDDIIRSKTIAKVTSTHVTCTYDDGSYCVPCVLMAC